MGQMDKWKDRLLSGWMDGQMDGWKERRINGQVYELDGQVDGQMYG